MKKKNILTLLMISVPSAVLLLAGFHYNSADLGHFAVNLATSANQTISTPEVPPTISAEAKAAGDLFIDLTEKSSFFSARYKLCRSDKNDFLCELFADKKTKTQKALPTHRISASKINQFLKSRRYEKIENASQRDSIQAISRLNQRERNRLYDFIDEGKVCTSPNLIAALAFKWEEQLPNPATLIKVRNLYNQVLSCSSETEFSDLGLYRGGLISVWQNDYTLAESYFKKLNALSSSIPFTSRANFWLKQVHRSQGLSISTESLNKSFESYPLSFHSLNDYAEMEEGPFELVQDLSEKAPQFRSQNPNINLAIELVEYLKSADKHHLAKRVLEFMDYRELEETEPGVQLYVGTLISEFEDMNHQRFRVLSKLFQKYPEYKTIKNLQIYYPLLYDDLVVKHRRDQEPSLLISLIRQESSFNPRTQSPVGASGLMQIMPRTAADIKRKPVSMSELFDPNTNVQMGARYFSNLVREHKNDHMKALASYNAGSGNVKKWTKRYPVSDPLLFVDLIPFEETREYVAGILRNQYWYAKLYPQLAIPLNKIAGPISTGPQ